ncbi:hypothetical protein PBRA_007811 [Plasmodiophora brassicae]|uniref:EGF-like domain-containing protein n=1 Tax=Plasmodiophora brassicae TaxID=37360 RepID=A0A0G4IXT2_PLABS|nr:hypothetical protein PBRA_007811 [Plasmodiophora brassicae]
MWLVVIAAWLVTGAGAWYPLRARARCLYPGSVPNCTAVMSARTQHVTTHNDTHVFVFGGRANVFFNTSLRHNIGALPPYRSLSVTATINPGSPACAALSNCWYRGVCNANGTCACAYGYSGADCSLEEDVVILDDFWIYDIYGQYWMQVPKSGAWPTARVKPSFMYHDDRLVMYAGYSQLCGDFCNDVWEYRFVPGMSPAGNASSVFRPVGWTMIGTGPSKRWQTATVLYGNCMVIHGGHHVFAALDEVWKFCFDSYNWTRIRTTGPASQPAKVPLPRLEHAASVYKTSLYIYGGMYADVNRSIDQRPSLGDMWKLDLTTGIWTQVALPGASPQERAKVQSVVIGRYLYMFGGFFDEAFYQDTWQFDLVNERWALLPMPGRAALPAPRGAYSLIGIPANNTIIMVGGNGWVRNADGTQGPEHVYNDVQAVVLDDCAGSKYSSAPPCSGNGVCLFGTCRCDTNWFDDNCSMRICPGDTCSFVDLQPVCVHCQRRGTCVNGACRCNSTYRGQMCNEQYCPNTNCSLSTHGTCIDLFPVGLPTCTCLPAYYGVGCEMSTATTPSPVDIHDSV